MFLNPLGLLALIGVPAILGLHLFRRRFQRHAVSAVFLWEPQDRAPVAGRKREPLRTSPSFWCEIIAALLLALAFAGLRAFGAGEAQHLVVVLDASASMGALTEEGPMAERAREFVRDRVGDLTRGSRVTIVESGPRPSLLAGPAAFTKEALAALDDWRPTMARHDLGPAVALGQQLSGDGDVLLITDHFAPDAWPEDIEVAAVGVVADNLAITNATRRRAEDEESGDTVERIHLTITSFARANRATTVTLLAEGQVLDARRVELEPGEREHVAFVVPADSPVIEARLPEDALAIDDVAWLAPEPPRTLALASTLPQDLSIHLGLMTPGQAVSNIDRWLDLVPDSIDARDPAGAHLVISAGRIPGNPWCLSFESAGEERKHLIGPFLLDRRHELLEGITLEGIIWSASDGLDLDGAPIVSAGNLPIFTDGREGDRRVFQMNLDPKRSSLHRSPDWPILLTNVAELRRRELPGPARASLAIGETLVYRDRREAEYVFEGEGEVRSLRAMGTLAVEDVTRPGVYRLARIAEDGTLTELCLVAYSFADPAESDLRGMSTDRRTGQGSVATMLAGFSWMEIVLLVAALSLIALDWYVLSGLRSRKLNLLVEPEVEAR